MDQRLLKLCAILLGLLLANSTLGSAEPVSGWRGNGTGIWTEAKPCLEWHRTPVGAVDGLRASAQRQQNPSSSDAAEVEKGLVRPWLVIGPFDVPDSVQDFDREVLTGETAVEPTAGEQAAGKTWTELTGPPDDILEFGAAELPWLDLGKALKAQQNQLAYAHTCLHSPRGGRARIVVDHAQGLKAWVNSREVYRSPQQRMSLSYYTFIGKHELHHLDQPSARFDLELKPGWNRLLLKLSSAHSGDQVGMRCSLRIMDPPDVSYESRNILWMTPLAGRSTSTPIIVGERIYLMAEPDELVCLDKRNGRILWSAAVNYYECLTLQQRQALPALVTEVDPLVARLKTETDPKARTRLRAQIQKALHDIDGKEFDIATSGHFEGHFGIVGFTMPTPVSDGHHVYVWSGMGVAACYDLEGRREWITRVDTKELNYGSSPALADGVLVVFLNGLFGLDAKTGRLLWKQPKIRSNIAALLATRIAGQSVIVTQRGDIVRPSDGQILVRQRGSEASNDMGWAPPVIVDHRMYLQRYGVETMLVHDLSRATADNWLGELVSTINLPREITLTPSGQGRDRWTAGSPLVWEGIAYQVDIYQTLYAVELKAGKLLYNEPLDLEGYMHYNAVPVAASPTLVGQHLFVSDNQGTTLVLEPGPTLKVVARNRIGTLLDRSWPIPAQETLCYAPPLADGNRLYFRGEAYLYCIGER